MEKQTQAFVKKVSSRDFTERIQKMVRRGYVANNERYHVPEQKSIGELLASVKWKPLNERVPDIWQTDERPPQEATQESQRTESKPSHSVIRRRIRREEERSEGIGR